MKNRLLVTVSLALFFYSVANFSMKASVISYTLLLVGIVELKNFKFNVNFLIFSLLLTAYFIFSLFISKQMFEIYFLKYLLLYPFFFIFSNSILVGYLKINDLDKVVKYYLLFHALSFCLQIVVYLLFDHYLDFNSVLREKDSNTAYMSRDMIDAFIPIRPTGIFSEPSFYAMSVLPALIYLYVREVSLPVFYISVATVVFSFSVAALIILVTILVIFIIFKKGWGSSKLIIIFLLFLTISFATGFVVRRVTDSADYSKSGTTSISTRMRVVNELLVRSDISDLIGDGFFINELGGNGVTGISAAGIRDSSTFFSVLYSGGVIGFFMFIVTLFWLVKDIRIFAILCCLLLFKYSILFTSFWIMISLIVVPVLNPDKKLIFRF